MSLVYKLELPKWNGCFHILTLFCCQLAQLHNPLPILMFQVPNSASKESHVFSSNCWCTATTTTTSTSNAGPGGKECLNSFLFHYCCTFLSSVFSYLQQLAPHPAMQQAGYYMQHPQAAAAIAQQQGLFPQKMQMQFNSPQQMHEMQQQLHQQAMQGQMGMRPGGANGMPSMHHTESTHGGSKQDNSEAGAGGDGQGNSAGGHGSGDGEDKWCGGGILMDTCACW